ncbi:hypothetical protein K2173_005249 [Erythroxylum novogranatense]|uniref:non-specific serine/threonine protein kinase n=1 Tax=Erythroxylum novogranatense TaxID=1862640 RepID=A0AAV8TRQ0_9ROSI|nr:hypothetical protein K2173_005249 [Erythroxylum novogranatense]
MTLVSALCLLFQCLLFVHVRSQLNQSNVIDLGSSLNPKTPPTSWPSPSGQFAFGFYRQGNGFAVGIWMISEPGTTVVVWTANRDDPPVSENAKLELTRDDSASMLDSGNFVLYCNGEIIWQTFDFPTDTLLEGQNLKAGNELVSSISSSDHSSGRFQLSMQTDGNLVAYPIMSHEQVDAYWSTGTFAASDRQLNLASLDRRCVLYLQGGSDRPRYLVNCSNPTEKDTIIYRATLDADGIFRLYSHQFENNSVSSVSMEWTTLLDQCDVKGACGFNSYCYSNGGQSDCYCYPGYFPVEQSGNWSCSGNHSEDICMKDCKLSYNMTSMENMWLADFPYSYSPLGSQECSISCEQDCDCWAAVHENYRCGKFRLPLRYGRHSLNSSATTFLKVILPSPSKSLPSPIVTKEDSSLVKILAITLGTIAFLCFALLVYSFLMYYKGVHSYRKLSGTGNSEKAEDFAQRAFSYSELQKATNDFKEELGMGSYGAVYKGTLPGSNKTIAVKRLEKVVEEAEREFRAEMTAIGRTHHRNLVRLLGFCVEGSKKLLVYEYMSNGSLAEVLGEAEKRPAWKERVRIAMEVARGILYLHEECEIRIIHCNLKPQNILMDETGTPKISDFGLAKLLRPNEPSNPERFTGTRSYLAPEWQMNAIVSVKADIYSFGVILLEIVCCTTMNISTTAVKTLSCWIHESFMTRQLNKLVEADDEMDHKTLERMVKVGLWCIQEDPVLRPTMKSVILMLEGIMDVSVPPFPSLSL